MQNLKLKLNKYFLENIKDKFADDGSGWLFLQQLFIAPMSLFTTVILAKILSIGDYGFYKYILSMYSIIAIFGFSGISSIASLNIQRGQDHFFDLSVKYKKLFRWIPSFIALIIGGYYFYNGNSFLAILFFITIFSHFFNDLYGFYAAGFGGKGAFRLSAIFEIVNYFISYFPPILVAYIFKNDVNVVILVFVTMFLCQFIFRFFTFHYVRIHFGFNKLESKRFNNSFEEELDEIDRKNFKKESIAISFNNIISGISGNAAGVIIFNRLGASETSIYSLAITFADFTSQFITAPMLKIILNLSKMTKRNENEQSKIKYIKSQILKYIPLIIFITIFTILTLPLVYKFLFTKYYDIGSYKYAMVYSISILSITFSPVMNYFLEKRNFKLLNTIQIITTILNISSLFFSAIYFGIWGAIVVSMLMKFVNNLICVAIVYNDLKQKPII